LHKIFHISLHCLLIYSIPWY